MNIKKCHWNDLLTSNRDELSYARDQCVKALDFFTTQADNIDVYWITFYLLTVYYVLWAKLLGVEIKSDNIGRIGLPSHSIIVTHYNSNVSSSLLCFHFECVFICVAVLFVWWRRWDDLFVVRWSSFFWQLIAVIASSLSLFLYVCVYICHFHFRMAMKNCFPTIQQKDLLFVTLAFIPCTNHLVCPTEHSMCHICRFYFVRSLNGIGLFRHFGLTIGFCIQNHFVLYDVTMPFSNNSQNAGNNIIRLMTLVNKILSLWNTSTNHRWFMKST